MSGKISLAIWASMRENLSLGGCKQNGPDQPAHLRSLISDFVIHILESIISRLATTEILIFELVPLAEETGLSLPLSKIPKTGCLAMRPK